jgi:hypothetical protein
MTEEIEAAHDQREVNKVVRVLNGKRLKYTVHILMKDGTEKQCQTDKVPSTAYDDSSRTTLIVCAVGGDDYLKFPICRFDDVDMIQVEVNEE